MNSNAVFPIQYERELNSRKSREISDITRQRDDEINAVNKRVNDEVKAIEKDMQERLNSMNNHVIKLKDATRGKFSSVLAVLLPIIIVICLSIFVWNCFCVGFGCQENNEIIARKPFIVFCVTLGVFLLTGIVTWIIEVKAKREEKALNKARDNWSNTVNEQAKPLREAAQKEIEKITQRYAPKIAECGPRYQKEAEQYAVEFKAEATKLAESYVESELVSQMAERAAELFKQDIRNVNRDGFNERVEVQFTMQVSSNSIVLNGNKTIKFSSENISPITEPLRIMAVAEAIALRIQVEVQAAYPQSPSGTTPELSRDVTAGDGFALVNMIYSEPNGNYRPLRSF